MENNTHTATAQQRQSWLDELPQSITLSLEQLEKYLTRAFK